ncbi:hypothetical protein AC1031_008376 [Aphanomyces cochlioides]|nr:hypothetical protein AC1031_008376 [Aphanomyces cochlioides]
MKQSKSDKHSFAKRAVHECMVEVEKIETSLGHVKEGIRIALKELESHQEAENLAAIEAFVEACARNDSRPARAAWLRHQFQGYKLDLTGQVEAAAAGDVISVDESSSEFESSPYSDDSLDSEVSNSKRQRLDRRGQAMEGSKQLTKKGPKGKGKANVYPRGSVPKIRVLTVADVRALAHVPGLSIEVREAYCKAREARVWSQDWMNKFQSFLPGTDKAQVEWNCALRAWWQSFGDCVWGRYFWVGTGNYCKPGWTVPREANHVKSRLESAKKRFVDLLLVLERVAGPEVFHYLLFNIHPFWPDLGMPACMLKELKSAEAVEYIESQGRKRWPDFAQFPNLLYKKDLLAITMDPNLPPRAQLQWSWSLLKWMREKAKIKKQEVEEMVKRVEAGVHLEWTGPFPFVNYPDGVFEMPEWMRAQQSTDANFVGKWVGLPGRPVVMDQTDGSFLAGSDISGLLHAVGRSIPSARLENLDLYKSLYR